MNNRIPPSKPVLIAAVAPIPIAIACLFGFGYFGISLGVILSIVGLVAYYIIFGIVLVIINYKHDTYQQNIDKAASPALKAATILLIILTVGLIGGAFVGFWLEEKVIAFSCLGAWVGFIFLFVAGMAFATRVRETPPKSANRRGEGTCVICVPAFSVSFMTGFSRDGAKYKEKSNYKVIVDLDGRRLTAYSHNIYKNGDKVEIAYSDGSNKCYIV